MPVGWKHVDSQMEAEAEAQAVWPLLNESQCIWDRCLQVGDLDTALHILSRDSEQYVMVRATGSRWVPPEIRGRGTARLQKHCTAPRRNSDEGAQTCKLVQTQKDLRRAEEMARKLFLRGLQSGSKWICATFGPACAPASRRRSMWHGPAMHRWQRSLHT